MCVGLAYPCIAVSVCPPSSLLVPGIKVDDGVLEASRLVSNRHSAVAHCVQLVEATRLKTGLRSEEREGLSIRIPHGIKTVESIDTHTLSYYIIYNYKSKFISKEVSLKKNMV